MNRTPPVDVRRALRQEVGFGCPIPGCGSPYLEWHHFDPPWHVRNHHEPAGMIALCPTHHNMADVGTWTKEQLHTFKQTGKDNSSHVRGKFDWMRYQLLGVLGDNLIYNAPILFYTSRQPIIWFVRDAEGYLRVNMRRPLTASTAEQMVQNNDWLVSRDVADVECPPNGHVLDVKYPNGDEVGVEFREIGTSEQACARFPNSAHFLQALEYPIVSVEFRVRIPALEIYVGPKDVQLPNSILVSGYVGWNCDIAFAYGDIVHPGGVGLSIG